MADIYNTIDFIYIKDDIPLHKVPPDIYTIPEFYCNNTIRKKGSIKTTEKVFC